MGFPFEFMELVKKNEKSILKVVMAVNIYRWLVSIFMRIAD